MTALTIRVTVKGVGADTLELLTDQNASFGIPKTLAPGAKTGDVLFVACDTKPLISADRHAKDVINELIKE